MLVLTVWGVKGLGDCCESIQGLGFKGLGAAYGGM